MKPILRLFNWLLSQPGATPPEEAAKLNFMPPEPPPAPKPTVAKPPPSPTVGPPSAVDTQSPGTFPTLAPTPPAPVRARRTNNDPVIIGFDFGTHSTKVLARQRSKDRARVLAIDQPATGYPLFACPSLVRLDGDRLWFGTTALTRESGHLYRSLKVRLLGPHAEAEVEAFPNGPCPDVLVAAYLSWAFSNVKQKVHEHFNELNVRLNLAAPMNYHGDEKLKTRYLQIVTAAWDLSFGGKGQRVPQGVRLADIESQLRELLHRPVPDEGDRLFDVLPETVAPIVSMSLDPRMSSGMYMIVDVGAGTTEVSMNHVNDPGAEQRVLCYHDESSLVGGDRFERAELHPDLTACAELVSEITKSMRKVWAIGYRKDAPSHPARKRWRQLTVLLAGGGARRRDLEEAIRSKHPTTMGLRDHEIDYEVSWHRPSNIEFPDGLANAAADLPLLSVAHGLTRERQTWPIVFNPSDIEVLDPTHKIEKPEAYGYVGGK